jgi:hypothetical protein
MMSNHLKGAESLDLQIVVRHTRPQAGHLSYAIHEAIELIRLHGDEYRKDEVMKSLSSFVEKLDDRIDGTWHLCNQIDDLINSYYGNLNE